MFDLIEHLTTTLRRTFAADEQALPRVAAGAGAPSAPLPADGALPPAEPAEPRRVDMAHAAAPPADPPTAACPPLDLAPVLLTQADADLPSQLAPGLPPPVAPLQGPKLGPMSGAAVPATPLNGAALDPPRPLPAEPVAIPLDPETLEPAVPAFPRPGAESGAAGGRLRPARSGPVRTVVVIPAYNEEQTLREVILAAKLVPEVSEVIVVSDGSTDATAAVARKFGAICIELRQNVGKGGAMKVGIDRADADVFVFLDADLIGVTPVHIQAMIHPVLRGDAAVSIAQLEGGRVATDLASVMAPNLSGQRAVTRAILQGMSGMETTRFGVEIAMKRYIKRNHIPVVRVPLDISHRTKEEKLGLLRGFLARMKEYWEIVKVVGE